MRYFQSSGKKNRALALNQGAFVSSEQKIDIGGVELAVPEKEVYSRQSAIPEFLGRVTSWAQETQLEKLKKHPKRLRKAYD